MIMWARNSSRGRKGNRSSRGFHRSLLGNFIADALAGRNIAIKGDGTLVRSYLYAADLAIWLRTLLLRGGASGENPLVLNVGSSEAISIRAWPGWSCAN